MEASALKPVDSARLNMDDMPPETIRARDVEERMSRRDAGESFLKKKTFDVIRAEWVSVERLHQLPRCAENKKS